MKEPWKNCVRTAKGWYSNLNFGNGAPKFSSLSFPPLLPSYGAQENLEASGYLKIYDYMDEQLTKFREQDGTEIILLIDILACDTNFGYDFKQSWRKLDTLNGVEVL